MRRRPLTGLLLVAPPVLLVGVFVGLPVLNAFGYSLGYTGGLNRTASAIGRDEHETTSWLPTLDVYRELVANPRFTADLSTTVGITLVTTATVLVLAWALALYLKLLPSRVSRLLPSLAVVPMFIPGVIGAWAILGFYAADGLVGTVVTRLGGQPPPLGFTTAVVLIAQVWTSMPFAVLLVTSGVAGVPDHLIEAARDAGASTVRVVRSIILPMAAIPTVIAGTFTAIGVVGSFTVPYLVGPNAPRMLGVTMTQYFQSFARPQQSVAMAVVVFGIAALFGAIYVWANWRSARATGKV